MRIICIMSIAMRMSIMSIGILISIAMRISTMRITIIGNGRRKKA